MKQLWSESAAGSQRRVLLHRHGSPGWGDVVEYHHAPHDHGKVPKLLGRGSCSTGTVAEATEEGPAPPQRTTARMEALDDVDADIPAVNTVGDAQEAPDQAAEVEQEAIALAHSPAQIQQRQSVVAVDEKEVVCLYLQLPLQCGC